jgi:hypothetical protein
MFPAPLFDLAAYLGEKFPTLSLGGGLLHRWRFSVRFELGIEAFRERAPKLYESVFSHQDTCVLISQDWPEDRMSPAAAGRYYPVLSLPGAFQGTEFGVPQQLEHTDSDAGNSVLRWVQLPARSFSYAAVFEGIANADHARAPSVSSRVYFLNPTTDVLLHMYDDRGLDIIAATEQPVMGMRRQFKNWILDSNVDNC